MYRFSIRPKGRPILSAASKPTIAAYFFGLKPPYREAEWLDFGNRYRMTCTQTFEGDIKRATNKGKALSRRKHKDLTAYVGASAPAHIIDGWSFLGRSVDCALRGDTYSAAHFAYYAELRAAMGLLASEGVGIFNSKHAVVGTSGTASFPKKPPFAKNKEGTHRVVWPVLSFWSSLRRSSELLDELIQPEQVRISKWLNVLNSQVAIRAVGQSWLNSWGLDLKTISDDHDVRNLASYRPSEFRLTPATAAVDIATFVSALWLLFEPGADRRFHGIERHLLRSAWRAGGTKLPIAKDIEAVGLGSAESENWARFLASEGDPPPLSFAESATSIEDPTCHLRMISRAALLLFVASGAARLLLQNAGYDAKTIAFWWKRHGNDRGLWSATNLPDDPLDTWADVAVVLEDIAVWCKENPAASLHDLRRKQNLSIHDLGAFELVGIWSLLP
jgi:hypothetical protein